MLNCIAYILSFFTCHSNESIKNATKDQIIETILGNTNKKITLLKNRNITMK